MSLRDSVFEKIAHIGASEVVTDEDLIVVAECLNAHDAIEAATELRESIGVSATGTDLRNLIDRWAWAPTQTEPERHEQREPEQPNDDPTVPADEPAGVNHSINVEETAGGGDEIPGDQETGE